MAVTTVFEIDGCRFRTLDEFFEEIGRVLVPGTAWGNNLDAFNDILRGGFGTPEEGFTICWLNHKKSQEFLGYPETIRQLRNRLAICHPSNVENLRKLLLEALEQKGSTVFDWLVGIIRVHCTGGEEASDGVELVLA